MLAQPASNAQVQAKSNLIVMRLIPTAVTATMLLLTKVMALSTVIKLLHLSRASFQAHDQYTLRKLHRLRRNQRVRTELVRLRSRLVHETKIASTSRMDCWAVGEVLRSTNVKEDARKEAIGLVTILAAEATDSVSQLSEKEQ